MLWRTRSVVNFLTLSFSQVPSGILTVARKTRRTTSAYQERMAGPRTQRIQQRATALAPLHTCHCTMKVRTRKGSLFSKDWRWKWRPAQVIIRKRCFTGNSVMVTECISSATIGTKKNDAKTNEQTRNPGLEQVNVWRSCFFSLKIYLNLFFCADQASAWAFSFFILTLKFPRIYFVNVMFSMAEFLHLMYRSPLKCNFGLLSVNRTSLRRGFTETSICPERRVCDTSHTLNQGSPTRPT